MFRRAFPARLGSWEDSQQITQKAYGSETLPTATRPELQLARDPGHKGERNSHLLSAYCVPGPLHTMAPGFKA